MVLAPGLALLLAAAWLLFLLGFLGMVLIGPSLSDEEMKRGLPPFHPAVLSAGSLLMGIVLFGLFFLLNH